MANISQLKKLKLKKRILDVHNLINLYCKYLEIIIIVQKLL